ncbi:MAG: hypothetical protein AAF512_11800 [Pseudomonadota bacterium]
MINNWSATAFNQVPGAENEIHGDKGAKQYGFKGGLIPGATMAAYLIHPFAKTFGMEYLKNGYAHVRLNAPLYDGEPFQVEVAAQDASSCSTSLAQSGAAHCATADIKIEAGSTLPPTMRGDAPGDKQATLMPATPENMQQLQDEGCKAFVDRWNANHQMGTYLRDRALMADLFANQGYANPSFIFGMTNWLLAANIHMNPWVLVETSSQNFTPIPKGAKVLGETAIVGLFEKKGHEFVDADINLFDADQGTCFSAVHLRAIYRLRGM